eukprot:TRINITY_DN2359_c0_g1_i2.p1 TRINITY_DN2359_c0_g1~~TRINITY_DN2359_c0_g1_i2.p1  ORF type:complete len:327 (-),score=40.84 TRINITY_DN2359_c0_g1_i2:89-1069(-)
MDTINTPKPCRNSYSCKRLFCKYAHPCRYGVLCRKSLDSDPDHFLRYLHPKPCPSGADCRVDDREHIWSFSHVCKYHVNGGCKKTEDDFHTRRFVHPKPTLPGQISPISNRQHMFFQEEDRERSQELEALEEEEEMQGDLNELEERRRREIENGSDYESVDENEHEHEENEEIDSEGESDEYISDNIVGAIANPFRRPRSQAPRRHLFFEDEDDVSGPSPSASRPSTTQTSSLFPSESSSSQGAISYAEAILTVDNIHNSNASIAPSSESRSSDSSKECKICLDNEVQVALVPCGHALACVDCAKSLKKCPLCNSLFTMTMRIYLV